MLLAIAHRITNLNVSNRRPGRTIRAGPDRPGPGRLRPGMRRDGGGGGDEGLAGPAAARDAPRRRSGRAGRATGGSGPGCAATAEVLVVKAGQGRQGPGRIRPWMRRDGGGDGDEGRVGPLQSGPVRLRPVMRHNGRGGGDEGRARPRVPLRG